MKNSPLPFAVAMPKMETFVEIEDYDSRSGSDNIEVASGDDPDTPGGRPSRKKYHRHTPHQIQELEDAFKENPHPDEKARLELGKRLNLSSKQIKFWFQNRRTQMKSQMERHENSMLREENEKLRIENITIKEAMRNPTCDNCGCVASLGDMAVKDSHLRTENAWLRDELNRVCVLASKFLGRPVSSLGSMTPGGSSMELGVGRNGFSSLSSAGLSSPMGFDFGGGFNSPSSLLTPQRTSGATDFDTSIDRSMFLQLALMATTEVVKLAQVDSPLWLRRSDVSGETLNLEEYYRTFAPCIGVKPSNFATEATRASGIVFINSMALIDSLMDPNQWAEMFPCLLGRTSTVELISTGMSGTRDGALQLMQSEFQSLSPLLPVHQAKFLRFCKQQGHGIWSVVDVSVDGGCSGGISGCRRLPSGCIIQDMSNGYSKVIWVEHMEYDESDIHRYFQPLVRSGIGFGAQRWVANLKRKCECLAFMMSSPSPDRDHPTISPRGKRSIDKLAQRMTESFCAGVCGTLHNWDVVQVGGSEEAKLTIRKSTGNPGEPPGVVLSASLTVWMPVSHHRLFDFLRSEQTRPQWDVLSQEGPVQQMLQLAKGQDPGNSISLLRAYAANGEEKGNNGGMLLLLETSTDISGSMIVYAAVDIAGMSVVINGGDSSFVALLPSGFAIFPDFSPNLSRPDASNGDACGVLLKEDGADSFCNGCLLTVGFQILVSSLATAKLTMDSIDTVNTLVSRTVHAIRSGIQCS